jgi:hypothetical protein
MKKCKDLDEEFIIFVAPIYKLASWDSLQHPWGTYLVVLLPKL